MPSQKKACSLILDIELEYIIFVHTDFGAMLVFQPTANPKLAVDLLQ